MQGCVFVLKVLADQLRHAVARHGGRQLRLLRRLRVLACRFQPHDQGADLLLGPSGDAGGVDGIHLMVGPADGTGTNLDRPRPQALTDAQVKR